MTGRTGTPLASGSDGEASDLSREWRGRADARLDSTAQALENTAIIIERINGKLDAHEGRISRLEQHPAGLRSDITGYGGCLAMAIGAALSCLSVLIAATALILTLTR